MYRILLSISLVSIGVLIAGSTLAEIDPQDVSTGHVWLFDDVKGNTVEDDSANPAKVNGSIVGAPESVEGVNDKASKFDGISDGINVPNAASINLGSFPSETVSETGISTASANPALNRTVKAPALAETPRLPRDFSRSSRPFLMRLLTVLRGTPDSCEIWLWDLP